MTAGEKSLLRYWAVVEGRAGKKKKTTFITGKEGADLLPSNGAGCPLHKEKWDERGEKAAGFEGICQKGKKSFRKGTVISAEG